jgi:hypothetical protein
VAKVIVRLTIAAAALAAAPCFHVPAARASFGNAPWCLSGYEGHLDCEYNTFEQCEPNVGPERFCSMNPAAAAPAAPAAAEQPRQRKQRAQ